jgi:hypothetical protein
LQGVLSVRIYEKEHSLDSLLDASKRIDTDIHHLIVVPLSEAKMPRNFINTTLIKERFFNLYEMNRRLSNINSAIIKERKRVYSKIYQVVLYTDSWF